MTAAAKATTAAKPEVLISRTYDAPRPLVWEAITQPQHLEQWFGPHGFSNHSARVELRAGGEYSIIMQGPGGFERKAEYTVTRVAPVGLLELEATGGSDPSTDDYFKVRMIFELAERGAQTILTLTGIVLAAGPNAKGPFTGGEKPWGQSLDRLGDYLNRLQTGETDERRD